jgi:hypothetical protein
MAGSGRPEVADIASLDVHIQSQLRAADELAARCESLVNAIIDRLVGGSGSAPIAQSAVRDSRTSLPRDLLRRELRRIGRTGYGAETRGTWINDDGSVESITSGRATPWYRRTRAVLTGLGRRHTALDTHCEAQAVVRMQQEGRRHATIVLSRRPCGTDDVPPRPYTCDSRLGEIIRRLLPPGSTLTVVDPDEGIWTYPKEDGS